MNVIPGERTGPAIRPLGELVDFLDSKRRPVKASERRTGTVPYYGANGQQGVIDGFLFDEPLVLLAEDGGYFAEPSRGIAYGIEGKSWVNNHAHVLRPRAHVELRYLVRVLENYDVRPFITGTTRGKLTKSDALGIPIPLPSLPEQRRIAEVLDRADALRVKRREAFALLGQVGPATYAEMFGRDQGSLPLGKLLESAPVFTDGDWVESKDQNPNGDIRLTQLADVGDGKFLDRSRRFLMAEKARQLRCTLLKPEDVLVARMPDPLGRACLFPPGDQTCVTVVDVCVIRTDRRVHDPVWLMHALNSPAIRSQISGFATGTTRSRISRGNLAKVMMPKVSIDEQIEFRRKVEAVDASSVCVSAAVNHSDALFNALQRRAFAGEL